jgi:LCP family protein required for cell wall assembly
MPAPSRHAVRVFSIRYAISLALASALVIAGVSLVNRRINDTVKAIPRIKLTLASPPPQGANFLLIGSDTRSFVQNQNDTNAFGSAQQEAGQRSDTIMVAHVEPDAQRTYVVSFPRDTMVHVTGLPGLNRINAAYSNGGAQGVINTLRTNFGIEIHHYLEVDFKSFQSIVDAIGHVRVWIPGKVRDVESGVRTPFGAGCYPLNGAAALAWVRSRTLEIEDPNGPIYESDQSSPDYGKTFRLLDQRADLDRIARQQSFIRKLAALAISKSLGDPFLANDIADNVLKYLKADQKLGRDEVNSLIRSFRTINANDQTAVQFVTFPTLPDPDNPTVTLVPDPDADPPVLAELNTFGDNTPKAPSVVPSQVTVDVTDGTGRGLAAPVADELVKQGFHARSTAPTLKPFYFSEIRYGPAQAAQAKLVADYFPDARLVEDPSLTTAVSVTIGAVFGGLTVPSTTPSTVPAAAAATTTPPPTTTTPPDTTSTTLSPEEQNCN